MSFSDDIRKFNDKTQEKMNKAMIKIGSDMSKELIMGTPHLTGMARRNWFLGLDYPITATTTETDKGGSKTVREAANTAKQYKAGQTIYITNSLPYIRALEDGHSAQRPKGWVLRSVRKYRRIARNAARNL